MARELYSKTKLALELGVDRRTLDQRLDGIAPAKEGARNAKLYYMRDVFAAFLNHAEQEAARKRKPGLPDAEGEIDAKAHAVELASAKLRREQADAELAEIKVARERGLLIEADRVEELWGELIGAMRARLLSLPSQAAIDIVELDRVKIEATLDEYVREAVSALENEQDELETVDQDEDDED